MTKAFSDKIAREHPTWKSENVLAVSQCYENEVRRGELEAAKVEVLLESPCMKCRREMGTHTWNPLTNKFLC